ncbi:hypothetical protein PFLA_b0127 [Pseudoalteromonas flavipulchra NCIMB 2033 = ATCC BAA-314]|nr:hypothetical protein [Pseudoalteromonas flavipulchra NCIMB 2033 = ATCC BAA-314]
MVSTRSRPFFNEFLSYLVAFKQLVPAYNNCFIRYALSLFIINMQKQT